jgi:hypothetical protein
MNISFRTTWTRKPPFQGPKYFNLVSLPLVSVPILLFSAYSAVPCCLFPQITLRPCRKKQYVAPKLHRITYQFTEHSTDTAVGTPHLTRTATDYKAVVLSTHNRHASNREYGMSKHRDWVATNYISFHGIDLLELPTLISVT